MYNMEDMDGFEIDTSKNIYIFILFVVCINCLFICSMLKEWFCFEWNAETASVCLMPIEEDPSTVVLDDDKWCAALYLELDNS